MAAHTFFADGAFTPPDPAPPLAVRLEAADAAALERVAAGPLPGGVRAGEAALSFFRDVYLDTPEGDLARRGVTALVRYAEAGRAVFTVEARGADGGEPRAASDDVPAADPAELLAGVSAAARLLRAVVDPARLVAALEIETRRWTRLAWLAGDEVEEEVEVACDARTVRGGGAVAELAEVEVRAVGDASAAAVLVRMLEEEFGVRLAGDEDPLHRARRALDDAEAARLGAAVRAARRVAVAGWRAGRLTLLHTARGLRIPVGEGSGEEAALRVLRETFGPAPGRVRLLGTGPGAPGHPATEVWLADVDGPARSEASTDLVTLPLAGVLDAVGSPALRDDATLAALHVLSRAGLPTSPDQAGDDDAAALRAAPALAGGDADASLDFAGEGGDDTSEVLPPGSLLNMELSVLAFNRRVLDLAADDRVPLLERLRFLSIFSANLDEFFRVRVAGFKRAAASGSAKRTMDGVTPREQLDAIGVRARRLGDASYRLFLDTLLPALEEEGVRVVGAGELKRRDETHLREFYDAQVHALLTPLAAGPGHPFPHVRNQRPSIIALLRQPRTGAERLGVVELPDGVPRFVPLEGGGRRFVPLETVILGNLERLYPGMEVDHACTFRVTRSAELHLDTGRAGDLLQAVEEEVRRRRFRPVVRVEVENCMRPRLRAMLLRELQFEAPEEAGVLGDEDVFEVERMIDLRAVRELAALDLPGLRWTPEEPGEPLDPAVPIVNVLQEREVLVSFPRDSFEATVERFVLEAAEDPAVVAIKLALYRTNKRSRIVEALRRASARGKEVVALVELTARFDEERNIQWARYLRSSGIHVVYGVPGLKIHAKVALVVRREEGVARRYVYIGTGNLNAATASAYTDLGLLSADPALGDEVSELFNVLTGGQGEPRFSRLLVSPYNLRRRFVEMIDREAEHARAGRGGHIVAKFNGLADRQMIAALYRASRAGVRVELIVRSICSLRPGVAGVSENIRVFSILGRYLEHARIFRFENAGNPEHYLGSADWRTRNLSRRVEMAAPVRDPGHRARLDAILHAQLNDPDAWELGSDGTYYKRPETAPRDPALPPPDPDRDPIFAP
jgi:polyphosphate kinase